MVFRKPYAFIIKHFKKIHIAMLACLIFFLITLSDIRNLFASLQKTNTLMYPGADIYINPFVFILIILVLALTGVLYWLLREKKKPTVLYLSLIIYLVLLIPVYSYLFSVLEKMIENIISIDSIILCKDIAFIASVPSYVFIVLTFIRGIGFNLKQFNFSKDLKELQIQDEDSAEVEINFGQNNYKYFRFVRRAIREIKYYIIENKFAFTVMGCLLGVVLLIVGIRYYNDYMRSLKASEATSVNGIAYTVLNSYITTKDTTGETVDPRYKYVIVYLSFYNSASENKPVDLDLITLANGSKVYYHPTLTMNKKFYDMGPAYNRNDMIGPQETKYATLAFELPSNARTNDLKLRVRYGIDDKTDYVVSKYRKFAIKPTKLDKKMSDLKINIGELMTINPVGVNRIDLIINDYKVLDVFDNKFVLCNKLNKCNAQSDVVSPETKDVHTMLMVSYDMTLYEDSRVIKTLNTNNKIFENYLTVKYTINGRKYSEAASIVKNSDVDDKIFLIVPRKIRKADDITIELNVRNDKYIIPLLKDES